MNEVNNIKILGEGTISSGTYNSIKILGEATGIGEIECETLNVNGELNLEGSLNVTDEFKILGEAKISNNLNSKKLKVLGELQTKGRVEITDTLKVLGEFEVENILKFKNGKIIGELKSKNMIEFEEIKVIGELYCDTCQGTNFISSGRLNITNLLSGDNIQIDPYSSSNISEIGGSNIIIKKFENKNLNIFNMRTIFTSSLKRKNKKTTIKLIEGDNIVLQNTICDIVRGENITILENCEIKRIEYKEKLNIDESSCVGESICLKI